LGHDARARYDELTVLAFDHRSQFEDLVRETGAEAPRIAAFKALALRAVDFVAAGDKRFGVLVDGRYGFETLAVAADTHTGLAAPSNYRIRAARVRKLGGCRNRAGDMAARPGGQMPGFLPSG